MRKIALEEHFVTPDLVGYGKTTASIAPPHVWREATRRLLDVTEERLPAMDAAGLDDPALEVVWERAAALDVPLYLHPANGVDVPHVLSGHPELIGPMWSWGADTATHALRLVFGGVFDRYPNAKLLLGHMGEGLPYALWRLDSRWAFHDHKGIELARDKPSDYLRHNLYVTTSGVCDAPPLLCALLALGADHILFGTDYPFEEMTTATAFLATAPISESDRTKIAHSNAESLLKLN